MIRQSYGLTKFILLFLEATNWLVLALFIPAFFLGFEILSALFYGPFGTPPFLSNFSGFLTFLFALPIILFLLSGIAFLRFMRGGIETAQDMKEILKKVQDMPEQKIAQRTVENKQEPSLTAK